MRSEQQDCLRMFVEPVPDGMMVVEVAAAREGDLGCGGHAVVTAQRFLLSDAPQWFPCHLDRDRLPLEPTSGYRGAASTSTIDGRSRTALRNLSRRSPLAGA